MSGDCIVSVAIPQKMQINNIFMSFTFRQAFGLKPRPHSCPALLYRASYTQRGNSQAETYASTLDSQK
jgi:hypothetical protein